MMASYLQWPPAESRLAQTSAAAAAAAAAEVATGGAPFPLLPLLRHLVRKMSGGGNFHL